MGNLSANFSRHEFACHCGCGFDTVDVGVIEALQAAADYFHARINVHDSCRCKAHNETVGGEPDSQHMKSKAADIDIEGVAPDHVVEFFEQRYPDSHGIGIYDWGVHIDCRDAKARWDKRSSAAQWDANTMNAAQQHTAEILQPNNMPLQPQTQAAPQPGETNTPDPTQMQQGASQ